jgi:predicted nicotinamide N-methyase
MFNWQEASFGIGKTPRKTIGFGRYDKVEKEFDDEIYIRELSICDGGIGAACWDAAIILARWIYSRPEVFAGQEVVELGAGVGLPGITAARSANRVWLTDYLPALLDILQYNIHINAAAEDCDELSDDASLTPCQLARRAVKPNIRSAARVALLNWDSFYATQAETGVAAAAAEEDKAHMDEAGHQASRLPSEGAIYLEEFPVGRQFPVLIGSELTYSPKSVVQLAAVVDALLAPHGVMYEILSTDRDGVAMFCDEIARRGFSHASLPVPPSLLGRYGTKQRPESYRLWTFWRESSGRGAFPLCGELE